MNTSKETLNVGETHYPYVQLEERAAALYLDFARKFRENGDLSWFWLGLSMAEKQHALVLAFCECQDLLEDNLPEDSSVTRKLLELFADLEKRAARKDLSVDEAFLIAAELESSEINEIYDRLVRPVQGTSYFIRKKIETLGANHPDILAKASRKFGVSAPVLDKLIQLERKGV